MPQFFVDVPLIEGRRIELVGPDAKHIAQVLRLVPGDWLVLSDGQGRSFRARVERASARSVEALVQAELLRRAGRIPPALALASIRRERFEWALQKAVELGCNHIIPFISARTVRATAVTERDKRTDRWQRIAEEAAKQSGLAFRPEVESPVDFTKLSARFSAFAPAILFYEGEANRGLREILRGQTPSEALTREGLIVIGPEGGFTADEVREATDAGAITASLGPQILRVETAAVAAMAIWQYEVGNMDAG
jgi:16S rRNA (uracil1498-N3)-methyltransferase